MEVKLCCECKWSSLDKNDISLRCKNPKVNAKDPWALSNKVFAGTATISEREKKSWFAVCGMAGKLFVPQPL